VLKTKFGLGVGLGFPLPLALAEALATTVGVAVGVGGVPPDLLPPEQPAAIAEHRPTNAKSARFRGAIGARRLP
jgi:hypothetical protein